MKYQADCFQALLEGKTLEHSSGNYYRLIGGEVRVSRDPQFSGVHEKAKTSFEHYGDFEVYETKEQYLTDLELKISQKFEELRILLNTYHLAKENKK